MSTVIFKTEEEAIFQFSQKAVMKCLEHRKLKSSYEINELDNLIKALTTQPENATLCLEEHRYFGFIVLDLIHAGEGSVTCNNCVKQYRSNQLEAFTVEPDEATFKTFTAKKKGLKNPFLKRPKHFPMYGGKGYRCPRGHMLIYMLTWTT